MHFLFNLRRQMSEMKINFDGESLVALLTISDSLGLTGILIFRKLGWGLEKLPTITDILFLILT